MTPEQDKKLVRIFAAALIVAFATSVGIYIKQETSLFQAKPATQTTALVQQGYNVPHNRATLLAANMHMLNAKPAARLDASANKNEIHTGGQLSTAKLLGVSEAGISTLFPASATPAVPTMAPTAAHEAPSLSF